MSRRVIATLSVGLVLAGCSSGPKHVIVVQTTTTAQGHSAANVVLTAAQAREVGRLTTRGTDPSEPEPAVAVVTPKPNLAVEVEVTYYCSEHPGRTYFLVGRRGDVRVLGTSAATEGTTGIRFCIPKR
jgi:hypothetical protein